MTVRTIAQSVSQGEISVSERVTATLDRIDNDGARLNAYTTILRDAAIEQATDIDRRARAGEPLGPLAGSLVSVKDCINVQHAGATVGSNVRWAGRRPTDSAIVEKFRRADAIILGKTNLDEWSFGAETSNPVFGTTLNPFDESASPGGSSGGSAVAVAAALADIGIGTDTGGSVRVPAAFCGVVGYKGRYDSIGREGVQPLAPSFDTVGFLVQHPSDIVPIAHAISGTPPSLDPGHGSPGGWKGRRVAILEDLGYMSEVVARGFGEHMIKLGDLGCEFKKIALPGFAEVASHFLNVTLSELAEQHADSGAALEKGGPSLRQAVKAGLETRATDYIRARQFCRELKGVYEEAMNSAGCDVLLTPSTPVERLSRGQSVVRWHTGTDEDALLVAVRYCLFVNMLGVAALSLPARTSNGDRFGIQLVGRDGSPDLALSTLAQEYDLAVS